MSNLIILQRHVNVNKNMHIFRHFMLFVHNTQRVKANFGQDYGCTSCSDIRFACDIDFVSDIFAIGKCDIFSCGKC